MGIKSLTIGECLKIRAEKTPDGVAIEYREKTYTWRMVDQLSDRMASGLCTLGMQKGEQAGIWSVNHPDYIVTFLALCKIGAVPVLINACYKEHEVHQIIQYADMKYLFYGKGYKEYDYTPVIKQLKKVLVVESVNIFRWGKSWKLRSKRTLKVKRLLKARRALSMKREPVVISYRKILHA